MTASEIVTAVLSVAAIIISSIALYKEFKRDKLSLPRMSVEEESDGCLYKFKYYGEYSLCVLSFVINSKCTSDFSILKVDAVDDSGNSYQAINLHNRFDGKDLKFTNYKEGNYFVVPINSANILNDNRLKAYDNKSCVVCFENLPAFNTLNLKVRFHLPTKKISIPVSFDSTHQENDAQDRVELAELA